MLALASKVNTLVLSPAPLAFVQTEGHNHNAHGIAGFLSELAGPPIGPAMEFFLRCCQARAQLIQNCSSQISPLLLARLNIEVTTEHVFDGEHVLPNHNKFFWDSSHPPHTATPSFLYACTIKMIVMGGHKGLLESIR